MKLPPLEKELEKEDTKKGTKAEKEKGEAVRRERRLNPDATASQVDGVTC